MVKTAINPIIAAWEQRLRLWATSGLALTVFCAERDLSPSVFYYWRKRWVGPNWFVVRRKR